MDGPTTKRSRSGCITCKIRRVKCDEAKPACQRCTSTGRVCDGYASSTTSHQSRRALADAVRQLQVVGPASRVLGDALPVDDVACFDFFRLCTASMTGSVLPGEFWSRQLLQASHAEPAVWRAAVAIGALHRRWEQTNVRTTRAAAGQIPQIPIAGDISRFTEQGVRHYQRAISLAKSISNPASLAVISVALAAAAHLAGRWAEVHVHMRAGLHLLRRMEAGDLVNGAGAITSPSDLRALAHTLERFDLQSMTFADVRAPYDYNNADVPVADLAPLLAGDGLGRNAAALHEDMDHAALAIFRMFRRYWILGTGIGVGLMTWSEFETARNEMIDECVNLGAVLGDLERIIHAPRDGLNDKDSKERRQRRQEQHQKLLSLRLYHLLTDLTLATGLGGPELRWDAYFVSFERMVTVADELVRNTKSPLPFFMSLEPGISVPLYLTATRCRHPCLRRRALAILRSSNRQEGIWNCVIAAKVAEQIILVEEEGLGIGLPLYLPEDASSVTWSGVSTLTGDDTHWPAWQGGWPRVPEEKRVLHLEMRVDVPDNKLEQKIFVVGSVDNPGVLVKKVTIEI
ncbi:hypothetical protein QBC34DRAFT_380972 [Podospora aff. communis PSN243]|uniref:Zn(2)-C6 fungal-type domain-containing protein n=1 Tax=Podospora aff. communis PSN243 TaxID=3040156 RepID=A0AAV9GKV0_9PEZI|nr:hypothetical protein QBC34DRAFT_380972 [Podospora aff. communis PSN243]